MCNHMRITLPIGVLAVAVAATGCDDPLAPDDPLLTDTAEIRSIARTGSGETGLPTAFDFTPTRFPAPVVVEAPGAGGWDVLLSEKNGEFVLVPWAIDPDRGEAAIVLEAGRTFEEVLEAPESDAFGTEPVPLQLDAVYIVRSRPVSGCVFFAKLHPRVVDATEGLLRFEYVANPNCNARKLGPIEES